MNKRLTLWKIRHFHWFRMPYSVRRRRYVYCLVCGKKYTHPHKFKK